MLHCQHIQWLEARGISVELAQKFGLTSVAHSFLEDDPGPSGEEVWTKAQAISIPFIENGKVVNHKYRRTSKKQHAIDKGGVLCLWNHDCLLEEGDQPVVICEGEWDAMVALSLGWRAVSVPNGTPDKPTLDVANAKRYQYLWRARDPLLRVKRFILATDDDHAGQVLRSELASMLGPDRCSFVEYPFPCKDLNEVLLDHGPEAVAKALNGAKPYPVDGLYRISDFPEVPPVVGMAVGIDCLVGKIEIVPSTLTVLTGLSNAGKSTVLNTVVAHAINNGLTVCVGSFETLPKPILRDGLARAMIGCSQYEFDGHASRAEAYGKLEQQLVVISNALDEDLDLDIDRFLELAEVAVKRDGARLIVLDPWNEIEHRRNRDETLTEYVGRSLRAIKKFCRIHGVAFWIVAHPSKPMKGSNAMPTLYDISDSAHWANRADYGLVYHRADMAVNHAQLAVVKVRMGLPGERCCVPVKFNYLTGRICAY